MFLPALALTHREQESWVRTIWNLGLCSPEGEPGSVLESLCPSHIPGRSPRDAPESPHAGPISSSGKRGYEQALLRPLYVVQGSMGRSLGRPGPWPAPDAAGLLLAAYAVLRNHCGSHVNQPQPSPPLTHFQKGLRREDGGRRAPDAGPGGAGALRAVGSPKRGRWRKVENHSADS